MSSDDTQRKQNYLKTEILEDATINPDDFVEFMEADRENGADIDNWTFSELIDKVQVFKEQRQNLDGNNLI
jgi:hypothetical protein